MRCTHHRRDPAPPHGKPPSKRSRSASSTKAASNATANRAHQRCTLPHGGGPYRPPHSRTRELRHARFPCHWVFCVISICRAAELSRHRRSGGTLFNEYPMSGSSAKFPPVVLLDAVDEGRDGLLNHSESDQLLQLPPSVIFLGEEQVVGFAARPTFYTQRSGLSVRHPCQHVLDRPRPCCTPSHCIRPSYCRLAFSERIRRSSSSV